MNAYNLISLKSVFPEKRFWPGSRFRLFGVGMNVNNVQDDFYDYMLVDLPWEKEFLIMVNVTENNQKAGFTMCAVNIDTTTNTKSVLTSTLLEAIGNGDWFFFEYH